MRFLMNSMNHGGKNPIMGRVSSKPLINPPGHFIKLRIGGGGVARFPRKYYIVESQDSRVSIIFIAVCEIKMAASFHPRLFARRGKQPSQKSARNPFPNTSDSPPHADSVDSVIANKIQSNL